MAHVAIRIERKHATDEQAARTLRRVLRKKQLLDVTPAEAAAASGMPIGLCTDALFVLARRYKARLRVNEAGVIRFGFPTLQAPALTPGQQRAQRFKAWWRKHRKQALAVATAMLATPIFFGIAGNALAIYDAWDQGVGIPFPLVIGACLFMGLNMGLGTMVAAYNAGVFIAEAVLFGILLHNLKLWLGLAAGVLFYRALFLGSAWIGRQVNPVQAAKSAANAFDPMAFTAATRAAVQGFLFGPQAQDDLADERVLTAFLVEKRGVVTTGELMGLMGWDADEVAEELPRLLMDYGGDLLVTDAGGLVCRFDALGLAPRAPVPEPTALGRELQELGVDPAAMGFAAEKVWNQPEEAVITADTRLFDERVGAPRLWDASGWVVAALLGALAVGLAGLALDPEMHWFPGPGTWDELAKDDALRPLMQGFGVYPYLLALLPTLLRLPGWLRARWAYRKEAGFRALLRMVALEPEGRLMTKVDNAALARLQGDIDVERGLWVHFPRQASAAAEAARLRAAGPAAQGAIVYDTQADG